MRYSVHHLLWKVPSSWKIMPRSLVCIYETICKAFWKGPRRNNWSRSTTVHVFIWPEGKKFKGEGGGEEKFEYFFAVIKTRTFLKPFSFEGKTFSDKNEFRKSFVIIFKKELPNFCDQVRIFGFCRYLLFKLASAM